MNCYVESRDCFDSFAQPGGHPFQAGSAMLTGSGAVWARVNPEEIRSRQYYPLMSAGKLNLRQLNTLSY
jgi:hypothetical protein